MTKVKNVREFELPIYAPGSDTECIKTLVREAKLVLVESKPEEALLFRLLDSLNPNKFLLIKNNLFVDNACYYKPILISETEKIEDGNWYLFNNIIQLAGSKGIKNFEEANKAYPDWVGGKILALPNHFSPVQLQMIADGKFKNGDMVLIECEQTYKGFDWNESIKDDCIIYLNKSNHITIYPIKKKMFTLEEMESKTFDAMMYGIRSFTIKFKGILILVLKYIKNGLRKPLNNL